MIDTLCHLLTMSYKKSLSTQDYQRHGTTKIRYTFYFTCLYDSTIKPSNRENPRFRFKLEHEYTTNDTENDHSASSSAKISEEFYTEILANPLSNLSDYHISTRMSLKEATKVVSRVSYWDTILSTYQNIASLDCCGNSTYKYRDLDVTFDDGYYSDSDDSCDWGGRYDDSGYTDWRDCDDFDSDEEDDRDDEVDGNNIGKNPISFIPESIDSIQHLRKICLYDIPVITLPESISKLHSLVTISIENSFIISFPDSICSVPHLQYLYINDCDIRSLPDSVSNLTKLKTIELRDNKLETLPDSVSKLTQLQKINVDKNNLSILPEWIGFLTNLTSLSIAHNNIAFLPDTISNLTNLQQLDVSTNHIISLPESICNLTSLLQLDLSANQITSLPESIGNLTNLLQLDLSANHIISLPDTIGNLTSLTHFTMHNYNLTSLPESFSNLQCLSHFVVSGWKITSLPDLVCNLTQLKILKMTNCGMTSLPETIGNLTNIETLYLDGNKLQSLPSSLSTLHKLYLYPISDYITLHNNCFTKLSDPLLEMKIPKLNLSYNNFESFDVSMHIHTPLIANLLELNLSHSKLQTLPESIGEIPKLQLLNCSYNMLISIPDSIGNLTELTHLKCSHNNIELLPESVCDLETLKVLNCGYNKLIDLPRSIYKLQKLEEVRCTKNLLKYLPIQLHYCCCLRRIFFSQNPIEFIPEPLVRKLIDLNFYNIQQWYGRHPDILPLPRSVEDSLIHLMNDFSVLSNRDKLPIPRTYDPNEPYYPYNRYDCKEGDGDGTDDCDDDMVRYDGCSDWSDLRTYQEMSDEDMFGILKTCPYITGDARKFILSCFNNDDTNPIIPKICQKNWSDHPVYRIFLKDVIKRVIHRIEVTGDDLRSICTTKRKDKIDQREVLYIRLSEMMMLAFSRFDSFQIDQRSSSSWNTACTTIHRHLNELFTRLIDTLVPYFEDMCVD
jgi:Leucine-rich repeat (LRR) protein